MAEGSLELGIYGLRALETSSYCHEVDGCFVSLLWQRAAETFDKELAGHLELHRSWFDAFALDCKAPAPGEVFRMPGHAESLALIAHTKGERMSE